MMEDDHCSLSNNLSENAIRPFTVGRKNWLFSASPKGAASSAIVYTMVEMKKANDLKKLEDHITECAKKEGYQINTKIFDKLESYQNRLSTIKELEDATPEKDLAVREIIHEITL